jgi:hypothetical protein
VGGTSTTATTDDSSNNAANNTGSPSPNTGGGGGGINIPNLPRTTTVATTAPTTTNANSDAEKARLAACCSAIRALSQAVGLSNVVASNAPKVSPSDLQKAVGVCDEQVREWHGDLNGALQKVKGAQPVGLPSLCSL